MIRGFLESEISKIKNRENIIFLEKKLQNIFVTNYYLYEKIRVIESNEKLSVSKHFPFSNPLPSLM